MGKFFSSISQQIGCQLLYQLAVSQAIPHNHIPVYILEDLLQHGIIPVLKVFWKAPLFKILFQRLQ